MDSLLQLIPEYRHYVWGGRRLNPAAEAVTAEAWLVYEGDRIAAGPWAGRTLAEAAAALGPALLGGPVMARTGARFPLLIKLLDCQAWLSVQVHPDDAQAAQMEGPGQFGKTEAWHILEAAAGAQLIAGVQPGTSRAALAEAIRGGRVVDLAVYHPVQAGDTVFMPAGTLHALGPGLLVYEVQQTSDITYRVFDWNRPASAGRPLHLEQSVAVTDPAAGGQVRPLPAVTAPGQAPLTRCPYFELTLLVVDGAPLELETRGESFHALTVIDGAAEVACGAERITLGRFETALVPAAAGAYAVRAEASARLLLSRVPAE
ncbi:MAG: class I mannose-6-phosphate isomerase [Anaerolineales bacterium]|nr:class I mannose-6-phosphate isomerase [Anaerolineales bacterium]